MASPASALAISVLPVVCGDVVARGTHGTPQSRTRSKSGALAPTRTTALCAAPAQRLQRTTAHAVDPRQEAHTTRRTNKTRACARLALEQDALGWPRAQLAERLGVLQELNNLLGGVRCGGYGCVCVGVGQGCKRQTRLMRQCVGHIAARAHTGCGTLLQQQPTTTPQHGRARGHRAPACVLHCLLCTGVCHYGQQWLNDDDDGSA
jgi:hypothetical protein